MSDQPQPSPAPSSPDRSMNQVGFEEVKDAGGSSARLTLLVVKIVAVLAVVGLAASLPTIFGKRDPTQSGSDTARQAAEQVIDTLRYVRLAGMIDKVEFDGADRLRVEVSQEKTDVKGNPVTLTAHDMRNVLLTSLQTLWQYRPKMDWEVSALQSGHLVGEGSYLAGAHRYQLSWQSALFPDAPAMLQTPLAQFMGILENNTPELRGKIQSVQASGDSALEVRLARPMTPEETADTLMITLESFMRYRPDHDLKVVFLEGSRQAGAATYTASRQRPRVEIVLSD